MATNPDFNVALLLRSYYRGLERRRWYHHRMMIGGTTSRLILRPLELADAEQIQAIFPRWEIVRYLKNVVPWPYPADGARHFCEKVALPLAARGEAWHWTLRLKSAPDQLIGVINLRKGEGHHRGFWLGLDWQRRGLMSEACVWANDYWFDNLGFPLLRVAKAIENRASRCISVRQGMRLVGTEMKDYVCGRLPSEIWEITAKEWHAWKARLGEPLITPS
jgi:RimJ/RimL family protein N-acetyltransferase